MKNLCSLLLFLFVSVASATGTNKSSLKNLSLSTNYDKFSLELIAEGVGDTWDRRTLTYRLSEQFDVGVVRNGFAGDGAGLEYIIADNITLLGIVFRSRYTRDKSLLVGIRVVF